MENKNLLDTLGERIRSERVRLLLTQDGLAERMGVKQQTIYKYEKGMTTPTMDFVYSLGSVGFNLQYVLFGREQQQKLEDFPSQVLQRVSEMVTEIENNFQGGSLSNETRLRMMLTLLAQYVKSPSSLSFSEKQQLELSQGK